MPSIETVVIGGGQAGLATGYHLQQRDQEFVILDASERVGDAWRNRWDSLRLFTPITYSNLPGMDFPGDPRSFPTKNETADYLEAYAERFDLPVELGLWVERLTCDGDRFRVDAGEVEYECDNVVVAMGTHQAPTTPDFADGLHPDIVQFHSSEYQNPDQLQDGGVLVVGAGNSGAEIGLEVTESHQTFLSGPDVGNVPFHIESTFGRYVGVPFVLRILFHRIFRTDTFLGRRVRPGMMEGGGYLVRTKPSDVTRAGIERVPRTTGVADGLPVVGEDRVLDVQNVVWATGYRPTFDWIDLPVFEHEDAAEPMHDRGVVESEPGLYFVGLFFLYAASSELLGGVGRDAEHVVDHLVSRQGGRAAASPLVQPSSSRSESAQRPPG